MRRSAFADDNSGFHRHLNQCWRPWILHPWPVVLAKWCALVLGPGSLGLASPSSGLGPRLLRSATRSLRAISISVLLTFAIERFSWTAIQLSGGSEHFEGCSDLWL